MVSSHEPERGLSHLYQGITEVPWSSILAWATAMVEGDLSRGNSDRSLSLLDNGLLELRRAESILEKDVGSSLSYNDKRCDLLRYYQKREARLGNLFAYIVAYEELYDRKAMSHAMLDRALDIVSQDIEGKFYKGLFRKCGRHTPSEDEVDSLRHSRIAYLDTKGYLIIQFATSEKEIDEGMKLLQTAMDEAIAVGEMRGANFITLHLREGEIKKAEIENGKHAIQVQQALGKKALGLGRLDGKDDQEKDTK